MDARYSDGEGMSDDLVLSESMQLLVAGHETSSNGLSWLLYLLSTRPETRKGAAGVRFRAGRCAAEFRATCPSSNSPRR